MTVRAVGILRWLTALRTFRLSSLVAGGLGTPVKDYRAPPLLGADTKDVLATIGYDEAKLDELKQQKII